MCEPSQDYQRNKNGLFLVVDLFGHGDKKEGTAVVEDKSLAYFIWKPRL